ncbi:MAG: UPF0280 family protein [Candidatus Acidiferrales bacterium]
MRELALARFLPDGRRLHLHDGPIDLIIEAFGADEEVRAAYHAAARRFAGVLDELCSELPLLRMAARPDGSPLHGIVARRMAAAVAPFAAQTFITPMAAVAGAVAEEILQAMVSTAALSRAYVNNGGDIALHLAPGERFVVGLISRPDDPALFGKATLDASEPVRGIATSGWRGRSFSLGIADAVTILADRAAMADAAATVVANAVDLSDHPGIVRVPACEISPDNDLGERRVTRGVGRLSADEISSALDSGESAARALQASGLIRAAAILLQGETRVVGLPEADRDVALLPAGIHSLRSRLHA